MLARSLALLLTLAGLAACDPLADPPADPRGAIYQLDPQELTEAVPVTLSVTRGVLVESASIDCDVPHRYTISTVRPLPTGVLRGLPLELTLASGPGRRPACDVLLETDIGPIVIPITGSPTPIDPRIEVVGGTMFFPAMSPEAGEMPIRSVTLRNVSDQPVDLIDGILLVAPDGGGFFGLSSPRRGYQIAPYAPFGVWDTMPPRSELPLQFGMFVRNQLGPVGDLVLRTDGGEFAIPIDSARLGVVPPR